MRLSPRGSKSASISLLGISAVKLLKRISLLMISDEQASPVLF